MEKSYKFYEALRMMQEEGKRMKEKDFILNSYWFVDNGALLACREGTVSLVSSVTVSMINYGKWVEVKQ